MHIGKKSKWLHALKSLYTEMTGTPLTSTIWKTEQNVAPLNYGVITESDKHVQTSIPMSSSDAGSEMVTEKMVVSISSADEYDPGVALGGSEVPRTPSFSSPLTGKARHGSFVVYMNRDRVVSNAFYCTMAGDFLTITTSLEVRKICKYVRVPV